MQRLWICLGSFAGLTAVAMAALTAHGLEAIGPARLQMARAAVQMQGWHALALLACGLWVPRGGVLVDWAGTAFTFGLLVFCGAVYGLALVGLPTAAAAPVGGLLLIAGWVLLLASGLPAGWFRGGSRR